MTSPKISAFTDLKAWQEAPKLVLLIYSATNAFPKSEQFGLTNQMRRAAVSVTSNLSEGFSRQSYRDKVQFYSIAHGSLTELQSQLMVARDIQYLQSKVYETTADQALAAHKLISGLIKSSKTIIHNS